MSSAFKPILLVFLGGGLGSVLRLAVVQASRIWLSPDFPFGTFIVNVVGGLAAGAIAAIVLSRNSGAGDGFSLFLLTGFLGGFTTFSAFSLDAVQLWQRGVFAMAALYVVASVLVSIGATAAGFAAVRLLT